MATYLALQDEVLNHGFGEQHRTRVKAYLNDAQAEIARTTEIRDLFTSATINAVAGTATYSLPSDVIRISGLTDVTYGSELAFIEDSDSLLAANEAGVSTGRSGSYGLVSAGLLLNPVPDSAYQLTLTYYRRPTDMSLDGDISLLPVDYHKAMVHYALTQAFRAANEPKRAEEHWSEFTRRLQRMEIDRQYEVAAAPRQVPGTWSDF